MCAEAHTVASPTYDQFIEPLLRHLAEQHQPVSTATVCLYKAILPDPADITEIMQQVEALLDRSVAAEGYVIPARERRRRTARTVSWTCPGWTSTSSGSSSSSHASARRSSGC